MKNLLLLFVSVFFFSSCTKDREFISVNPGETPGVIEAGSLLINEFSASGSTAASNDFGIVSDWLELYNPGDDTIHLQANRWIISDSVELGQNDEYLFTKDTIILPRQFLLVWCDSRDTVITEYHTGFNLSSGGEAIGIFYKKDDNIFITIDAYTYGQQTSGKTAGRIPDGGSWSQPLNPTPGAPNR